MTLAKAFHNGTVCAKGSHTVTTEPGGAMSYLLHGHVIARWDVQEGTFKMRHAGYDTVTTAKALNALLAELSWLPFTLKAWTLTDTRTGRALAFPKDGGWVSLVRNTQPVVKDGPSRWFFADEANATLAPTLGGDR